MSCCVPLWCGRLSAVTLLLANVDGVIGAYLIVYALRRENRDKDAVLVVGIVLLVCAGALTAGAAMQRQPTAEAPTSARV